MFDFDRYPKNTESQEYLAWKIALANQNCSPSPWVCIDHFKRNDYWICSDSKRFVLKAGIVPTIFNVFLIEVSEERDIQNQINEQNVSTSDENESEISEAKALQSQNTKLCHEIEQLKRKLGSQKLVMDSRIEHLKNKNLLQSKKIRDLEKQLQQYNSTLIASLRGLNVNALIVLFQLT